MAMAWSSRLRARTPVKLDDAQALATVCFGRAGVNDGMSRSRVSGSGDANATGCGLDAGRTRCCQQGFGLVAQPVGPCRGGRDDHELAIGPDVGGDYRAGILARKALRQQSGQFAHLVRAPDDIT